MSDELDRLDDAKLSETFAVEVAGWSCHQIKARRLGTEYKETIWKDKEGACTQLRHVHRFATSADAVLPFLEEESEACWPRWDAMHGKWTLGISCYADGSGGEGESPSFARAACIALIRAKRAQSK